MGAVGLVRVSGPRALEVVREIVRPVDKSLEQMPSHVMRRGVVVDPEGPAVLDQVLCVVMRAPRSYTGEDVVEISCHGSPTVLTRVVELIVRAGARLAEPGEFTRRAFLSGRLGLMEAEAVIELIRARSARAAVLAAQVLSGSVSDRVSRLREGLLDLVAGLEVVLDFPDDVGGWSGSDVTKEIARLRAEAMELARQARDGEVVRAGLTVTLVGVPNVGKSSLLNALLGESRAIVSPYPGTTRDLVDGTILIDGIPIRLIDTAGLRDGGDPVEAEGVARSRDALARSDLAMVVVDGSGGRIAGDLHDCDGDKTVVVINKIDLGLHSDWDPVEGVRVSAITGHGLSDLRATIRARVRHQLETDADEGGLVASSRQLDLLSRVRDGLTDSAEANENGAPSEVVLVGLREGLARTEQLLGIDVDEAVLDRIFSRFCVGK